MGSITQAQSHYKTEIGFTRLPVRNGTTVDSIS